MISGPKGASQKLFLGPKLLGDLKPFFFKTPRIENWKTQKNCLAEKLFGAPNCPDHGQTIFFKTGRVESWKLFLKKQFLGWLKQFFSKRPGINKIKKNFILDTPVNCKTATW